MNGNIWLFCRKEQDIDDSLVKEISQHVETCQQKSKVFFGRKDELKLIEEYLDISADPETVINPLIIHGKSGCGKTALVARAAILVKKKYPDDLLVIRFLGTTGDSSSITKLLFSICTQLNRATGIPLGNVPKVRRKNKILVSMHFLWKRYSKFSLLYLFEKFSTRIYINDISRLQLQVLCVNTVLYWNLHFLELKLYRSCFDLFIPVPSNQLACSKLIVKNMFD